MPLMSHQNINFSTNFDILVDKTRFFLRSLSAQADARGAGACAAGAGAGA